MKRRGPSDLVPIGQIISGSMEKGFLGLAKEMVRVFEVWDEAVGPFNAARARPESIKNGRLSVIVESSVWIDRFSYFKAEFIEKINQALGAPMVQEIIFRAGSLTAPSKTDSRPASPKPSPTRRSAQDPAITAAMAPVKDPELKKNLAALLSHQNTSRKE